MATIPNSETDVAFSGGSSKITFVLRAFDETDKGEWDNLLQESGSHNLFYDYSIIEAARIVWKKYQSLKVISGYLDNKLVFLQPIQTTGSGIVKKFELLRLPTSDANEPLVSPGQWDNATTQFLVFVLENFAPDIIISKSISERFYSVLNTYFDTAHTKMKQVRTGPVIYLPLSIEKYWSSLNSKSRNQLKRKLRRAQEAGFEFRVVHSTGSPSDCNLDRALDKLTRLHRMRFDSMNRSSFFVKSDIQKFHRLLCERLISSPVSFTFIEAVLDGEVVGSVDGMSSNQVYISMMTGFNPGFAAYSIGHLLIYKEIEYLIAKRIRVYDLKCGKEPYKRWWTKDYYESYDLNVRLNRRGQLMDAVLDYVKLAHRGRKIPKNINKFAHRAGRIIKRRLLS